MGVFVAQVQAHAAAGRFATGSSMLLVSGLGMLGFAQAPEIRSLACRCTANPASNASRTYVFPKSSGNDGNASSDGGRLIALDEPVGNWAWSLIAHPRG